MFPKTGNKFPAEPERGYATAIGGALQSELGDGHRAAKTVMRWTSESERSEKNWLEGKRGLSGWHLILLIRKSDAVALAVMKLAELEGLAARYRFKPCATPMSRPCSRSTGPWSSFGAFSDRANRDRVPAGEICLPVRMRDVPIFE